MVRVASAQEAGDGAVFWPRTPTIPHCFCKCAHCAENTGDATFSGRLVCAKCAQAIESKGDALRELARAREERAAGEFELPIANNIKYVTTLVNKKSRKIRATPAVLAVPQKFTVTAGLTACSRPEDSYPLYHEHITDTAGGAARASN